MFFDEGKVTAQVCRGLCGKEMDEKKCKGCYAAETGGHPMSGEPYGCALGYETDGDGHPKEECPKPDSWKKLSRLVKKENEDDEISL